MSHTDETKSNSGMDLREIIARAMHGAHAVTPWPADECETCGKLADATIAAIESSGTHCVVPLEPTEEMVESDEMISITLRSARAIHSSELPAAEIYRAMLSARPRP